MDAGNIRKSVLVDVGTVDAGGVAVVAVGGCLGGNVVFAKVHSTN